MAIDAISSRFLACVKSNLFVLASMLFLVAITGCVRPRNSETLVATEKSSMDPVFWDQDHLAKLEQRDFDIEGEGRGVFSTSKGLVGSLLSSQAALAGIQALRSGGNALDAAVATCFSEVVINSGLFVGFGGAASILYYRSGGSPQVYHVDGNYGLPSDIDHVSDITSYGSSNKKTGRTVLVPGFMRAMETAKNQFGSSRLNFGDLIEPAIYFAKRGVKVTRVHHRMLEARKDIILGSVHGSKMLLKGGRDIYNIGERFKQPFLAGTLEKIQSEGADYFYRGAFAQAMVDTIVSATIASGDEPEAERDKLTRLWLNDLATYNANVTSNLVGVNFLNKYIVSTVPKNQAPNQREIYGANVIEWFNLLKEAGLTGKEWPLVATDLQKKVAIARANALLSWHGSLDKFPDISREPGPRTTNAHAQKLWSLIDPTKPGTSDPLSFGGMSLTGGNNHETPPTDHSSAVVARDEAGNIAVIIHTTNSTGWNLNGLFSGGVAIPHGAIFYRHLAKKFGLKGGQRAPSILAPSLVFAGEDLAKPLIAAAHVGGSGTLALVQNTTAMITDNISPQVSLERPRFDGPNWPKPSNPQHFPKHRFSADLIANLATLGVPLEYEDINRGLAGHLLAIRLNEDQVEAAASTELLLPGAHFEAAP